MSGHWLFNCFKLTINWKNGNIIFFWHHCQKLCFSVNFSYWSKFHVSIMTGSKAMEVFIYKKLIRNLETEHTPMWVWPNIWRREPVRDTKFGRNVSNEKLLKAVRCLVYNFYCFWVTKRKTGVKNTHTHTHTHTYITDIDPFKNPNWNPNTENIWLYIIYTCKIAGKNTTLTIIKSVTVLNVIAWFIAPWDEVTESGNLKLFPKKWPENVHKDVEFQDLF